MRSVLLFALQLEKSSVEEMVVTRHLKRKYVSHGGKDLNLEILIRKIDDSGELSSGIYPTETIG